MKQQRQTLPFRESEANTRYSPPPPPRPLGQPRLPSKSRPLSSAGRRPGNAARVRGPVRLGSPPAHARQARGAGARTGPHARWAGVRSLRDRGCAVGPEPGKGGGGWRSRSKGRGRSGEGGSHVGVAPRARGCERSPLLVGVTRVRRGGGLRGRGRLARSSSAAAAAA